MASFGILFFFAVTGLTLNHQDWFAKQQRTVTYKGTVDKSWVRPPAGKEVSKLEIVEQLRKVAPHPRGSDGFPCRRRSTLGELQRPRLHRRYLH